MINRSGDVSESEREGYFYKNIPTDREKEKTDHYVDHVESFGNSGLVKLGTGKEKSRLFRTFGERLQKMNAKRTD